jgi:glycosyltransferase involved in cell wall biosynthesis
LKIGFFYPPYYPLGSGASVHGYHLVKGLKKRGHQILSCLGDGNPDCTNFERTKAGAIKMAMQADILYIRIDTFSFLKKATLLKLVRPFSLPVVWEVNAPTEELNASFPPGVKRDRIVRTENLKRKSLAKFVSAGIGVSETLKSYIQDFLGIKKAYSIPNGSDPNHFSSNKIISTPLIHLDNKFKIIWTGTTTPWQGLDLIVEIAKKMVQTHPDIIFIIVTNDSKLTFPILKNLLILRSIPYTDISSYIAASDICLCLYKKYNWLKYGFYGSSLKLFDYMASKKPVIASDMGQISTVINDGVNGLLVDNNVNSIIIKILELKTNQQKREYLGKNAHKEILKYYNWDRVTEQTEAVLLDVCGHLYKRQ